MQSSAIGEKTSLLGPFRLTDRHVHFNADGSVAVIDAKLFWTLPEAVIDDKYGRLLVSSFDFAENWRSWEMHPNGDELVYLLSGRADLVLRLPDQVTSISLIANSGYVIPAGVWHTARTREPCQILAVTRGLGTQLSPADEETSINEGRG